MVTGVYNMKITDDCIDYNTVRLIDDAILSPYDYSEQTDDADHQRILTLGVISGILEMAKAMKEVLKT